VADAVAASEVVACHGVLAASAEADCIQIALTDRGHHGPGSIQSTRPIYVRCRILSVGLIDAFLAAQRACTGARVTDEDIVLSRNAGL
jgi:hypothetical protein